MSENKARRFRFVYGVVFSLVTVALGILMIMQVWSIYRSAESSPYTVESISAHYQKIAFPIWLWVGALIVNVVLSFVFPETEKKCKAYIDPFSTLQRLSARLPEDGLDDVKKYRVFRIVVTAVATVLALVSATVCLVFLFSKGYTPVLDKEIFTQHGAAADRLVRFVPWLVGGFVACLLAAALCSVSVKKETDAVKKYIAESAKSKKLPVKKEQTKKEEVKACPKLLYSLRIALLLLGVVFVIVGIANGGMADVFEKAKNICTQCIGLG